MVGRCISHWNSTFLGDMLVFRGVFVYIKLKSRWLYVWGDFSWFSPPGWQACSDGAGEIGANICDTVHLRVFAQMCYSCEGWAWGNYPMDSNGAFMFSNTFMIFLEMIGFYHKDSILALTTLPETNSSHPKMDDWKTSFLLGWPIFRGYPSLGSVIMNNFWSNYSDLTRPHPKR